MKKIRIAALLLVLGIVGLAGLGHLARALDPGAFEQIDRDRELSADIEERKGVPSEADLIQRRQEAEKVLWEAKRVENLRAQGYTDDEIRRLDERRR